MMYDIMHKMLSQSAEYLTQQTGVPVYVDLFKSSEPWPLDMRVTLTAHVRDQVVNILNEEDRAVLVYGTPPYTTQVLNRLVNLIKEIRDSVSDGEKDVHNDSDVLARLHMAAELITRRTGVDCFVKNICDECTICTEKFGVLESVISDDEKTYIVVGNYSDVQGAIDSACKKLYNRNHQPRKVLVEMELEMPEHEATRSSELRDCLQRIVDMDDCPQILKFVSFKHTLM